MKNTHKLFVLIFAILVLTLASCSAFTPEPTATPAPTATNTLVPTATLTATPTITPTPSPTPYPTNTAIPTLAVENLPPRYKTVDLVNCFSRPDLNSSIVAYKFKDTTGTIIDVDPSGTFILGEPDAEDDRFTCWMHTSFLLGSGDLSQFEDLIITEDPEAKFGSLGQELNGQYINDLLYYINQERALIGYNPLKFNEKLATAAQNFANDLSQQDLLVHTSSNGLDLSQRLSLVNYNTASAGENIAGVYQDPQKVVAAWMNDLNARDNILSPVFIEIGLGVADNPATQYQTFIVADFATSY